MTIQLEYDDFKAIASKVAKVFKANGEKRTVVGMNVERFGITLHVDLMKEEMYGGEYYVLSDIRYRGLNSININVSYDYDTMQRVGCFGV